MTITLSVDIMGGDHGASTTVPASLDFLKQNPGVNLILVGDETSILKEMDGKLPLYQNQIDIIHTTQVVSMDELPQNAMRNKKDSSMRVAINLVKEAKAQAIVSAGNTGALMATAKYILKTIQGIDRPAIAKILPTINGEVCVLDLGANLDSTAENLFQFGIMGAQLMSTVCLKESPNIGILNIGSEAIKGHEVLKQAAELFKKSNLNFYGNVEGDDINKGTVDVVVCDGFTGNVALKSMEGIAKMISHFIKEEFTKDLPSKFLALVTAQVLTRIKNRLDPRKYNGAVLLGLNNIVVKSHGGADPFSFLCALEQAYNEVNSGVINLIEDYLKKNQELSTPIQKAEHHI